MEESTISSEERCRKNIATFLFLMGFHDHDPEATKNKYRTRLDEIEKTEESQNEVSRARKLVIKCGGESRTSFIVQQHPTMAAIQPSRSDQPPITAGNGRLKLRDFIRKLGGSELKLVIEKELTMSDVSSNQGRLLIPELQVKNDGFLTKEESKKLDKETEEQKKQSVSVWVFDPKGRKYTLNLAQWNMKNRNYVLKTKWNQIVRANGFKERMVIGLYSFRVNRQLCFAIARG